MPRIRRESRLLRDKAISSLCGMIDAFDSLDETARSTRVLLLCQHSLEMLLKAAFVQRGRGVFDAKSGRSFTLEMCLGLAQVGTVIRLSAEDAGAVRVVDRLRNIEQHWIGAVDEHLLLSVFGERLSDSLPKRALPIATDAPSDIQLLIDSEYSQISELLRPGKRARASARARIRTLLVLEGHFDDAVAVSAKDVDRVEEAVKAGRSREESFPRLASVASTTDGPGLAVNVHFTRKSGVPVRFEMDDSAAAGIREVDLQRRFHFTASELAHEVGVTGPRAWALRKHLGLELDTKAFHQFVYGKVKHPAYSERAVNLMREAVETIDLDEMWRAHNPSDVRHRCSISGCSSQKLGVK